MKFTQTAIPNVRKVGYNGARGAFTLAITPPAGPSPAATPTSAPTPTSAAGTPVPNACNAATVIPAAGGTFKDATSGTSTLSGTCATSNNSPEKVFQWTPVTSGTATIATCGTETLFDTIVHVRSAPCASGAQLACNDDTTACGTGEPSSYHGSQLRPTVTAGQTYFIVVDGYNGRAGAFALTVTPPP